MTINIKRGREFFIVTAATISICLLAISHLNFPFLVIAMPLTLIALFFSIPQTSFIIAVSILASATVIRAGLITPLSDIFRNGDGTVFLMIGTVLVFPIIAASAMQKIRSRQEKISELSERLNLATSSSDLGVWEWNVITDHLIWDKKMYSLYDIDEDQTIEQTLWQTLINKDDQKKINTVFKIALSGEQPEPVEFGIKTEKGHQRIIRSTAAPFKNKNGKVIKLVGINSDITHKHYTDQLLEQKNKIAKMAQKEFALLFEMAPGPLILINSSGIIHKANSAIHSLFGYFNGELLSQNIDTLLPDNKFSSLIAWTDKKNPFYNPKPQEKLKDILCKTKNGDLLEVETIQQVIYHNNEVFIIISVRDLTSQKQAELAISKAKQEAEIANQAKSEFIANMSHEIRTPLNATLGTVKLLQNTQLSNLQLNYLQMIEDSGESLLGILNDILDISKIEAGHMELSAIDFNLDDILNNVGSIMAINANEKDLDLIMNTASDLDLNYTGDPLRLQQILINLVSNAIKFTESGFVELNISKGETTNNEVCLNFSVEDSGIGISDNQKKHLFNAFSQADNSITRQYGGTGLGLLISKRLVTMMGGSISINSTLGAGSTFSFSVNLTKINNDEQISTQKKHNTLIIEPNSRLAKGIISNLERWHWPYTYVTSSTEAMELLKDGKKFELIILNQEDSSNSLYINHLSRNLKSQRTAILVTGRNNAREALTEQVNKQVFDAALVQPITNTALNRGINQAISRNNGINIPTLSTEHKLTLHLNNLHLLLVEDNKMNQIVAQGLLEQYGAIVDIASDGQKAIDLLKDTSSHYDVILMDIQMPVMDGFTTTAIIQKELKLDTPILAMTAGVMGSEKRHCTDAGMLGFICKPINVEEMLNAILECTNRPSLTEALTPKHINQTVNNTIFNPERLLKHVRGNPQRYNSILQMIGNIVTRNLEPLEQGRQALKLGDVDKGRRIFHSIKGSMGNIGATKVWECAQQIEQHLIEEGMTESLEPHLTEMEEQLSIMLEEAKKWLDAHPSTTEESPPEINDETFLGELERLCVLLSENNMQTFETYEELKTAILTRLDSTQGEALDTAIQNLVFQEALSILNPLRH